MCFEKMTAVILSHVVVPGLSDGDYYLTVPVTITLAAPFTPLAAPAVTVSAASPATAAASLEAVKVFEFTKTSEL